MTARRKIAGTAGIATLIYAAWVRPQLMRWGATDEEVSGPYPGADLVPEGERSPTMAVTIDTSPDQVWPWLVQMGGDHGGWYSWDCVRCTACEATCSIQASHGLRPTSKAFGASC
jgi:hypothetical protein